MADGIELASAYVTIIPSLKGATRRIESQLGGVDVSKAGRSMGKNLATSMAKGMDSAALKGLEQAVARAEFSVSQAMRKSEDATKRVEIAQKRLSEARAKYGDESSQAAQAELDLATAQRKAESASQQAMSAIEKLGDAQARLANETESARDAATRQASALGKIQSAASRAGVSLQSAGSALRDVGDRAMGLGGTLTAGIAAPMAAAVAAVGGFALSTASAAETTEISFTTMLGSAEAAEEMMGQLADFAAHTPFELSGLQTATRQLLAYGFTADDVIPMLTAVGDATAALGTGQSGIESVTRALGQMQTRGKASAEEMLQLTEAGIPAWKYLADAIGTDTAGAMEAVTNGAVDADTAIKAITDGMENDFGGMMEEQSKTVEGLFSNLSDAIEQPLMELRNTDAYEHFAEALSDVVDEAGPLVESALPMMEDGLDKAADLMEKVTDAMGDFADMSKKQQEDLIGMAAAAAGAGPALTVIGGAMKLIGTVGGGIGTILTKASDGMAKISSKGASAATATGKFSGALTALGTVAKGAGIVGLVALIGSIATKIGDVVSHQKLLEDATVGLDDAIGRSADSLSTYSADVDGVLNSLASTTKETADSVAEIDANSALLDGYIDTMERLSGKSDLTAYEIYELEQAVEGYNAITGDSVEITDEAAGKLSKSTDELRKNAEAWEDNAKVQALQESATQYYKDAYQAQQELAKAQEELARVQENGGFLSGIKEEELKNKVSELSEAYAAASDNAIAASNSAAIYASALDGGLKDALLGLPAEMQDEGLNIANAFAAGIESGSVSVGTASSFVTQAVNGAVATLPESMQAAGTSAATSLAGAISSGQITVDQAMQILNAVVTNQVSTLPPELQKYGNQAMDAFKGSMDNKAPEVGASAKKAGDAAKASVSDVPNAMGATGSLAGQYMASGISSQVGPVDASAALLASTSKTSVSPAEGWLKNSGSKAGKNYASGVGSAKGATSKSGHTLADATESAKSNNRNASGWGSELGNNFASGISSALGAVSSAAGSLASEIAARLHFSEPDVGPLVGINDSGYELGMNYADAMDRSVPLVAKAAERLAGAASFEASPEWSPGVAPYGKYRTAYQGSRQTNTYNITIDGNALNASPQLMEAFEAFMGALSRTYGMGVV